MKNNAIFINEMNLPRRRGIYEETDIICMYCYLLSEIKEQLYEAVDVEVVSLAERFRQKYVGLEYSLFSEHHNNIILSILLEALDIIDRNTSLKDHDYWYFYELIENFLLGSLHN